MPLWKNSNSANSAPKFTTDTAEGQTGIQEFGEDLFYVTGAEGYGVPPGWARKRTVRGKTLWESIVAFKSGTAVILPAALQIVGSRGEINAIEGGATTSTNVKQTGRSRHYIGSKPVSELMLGFNGFFVDAATSGNGQTCAELDASNSYVIRVALEIAGVTKRMTFDNGALEATIAPGTPLKLTDKILPSEFGLETFAAQTEIWVRAEREFVLGQKGMFHQTASNNPVITGESYFVGATGATSQLTGTGALTTTGGWVQQSHIWLPYCMIGRPVGKMMAVATFGASIENGVGDGQGDGINGAGGYMRRMLANVNGKKIARIHLAKSGETVKSWVNNSTKRRAMLPYVNHVISGHGGNDYSTGESLANTQTRWTQAWALMKANGAWVEHYALSPKSDSTDVWATLANQTPRLGFEVGGAWRDAGNAWCLSQVSPTGNLNGFSNLGDAQTDPTNRAKWRVDLGQPTIDGTHPTGVIADAMAIAASPRLEILRIAYEGA